MQCTDRKGRFFFHYSEYKGALNLLKIGGLCIFFHFHLIFSNQIFSPTDAVEFQESLDKRTGKPVAVSLVKVSSEDDMAEVAGKPVEGVILAEARNSVLVSGVGVSR